MISFKAQKHNLVFVLLLLLNQIFTISTRAVDINFRLYHKKNEQSKILLSVQGYLL